MADTATMFPTQWNVPAGGGLGALPPQSTLSGTLNARKILDDARALESAGCYALVLESSPTSLARAITEAVSIPTIGIGAGASCDGQVLVLHDMIGLGERKPPKFVKKYADLSQQILAPAHIGKKPASALAMKTLSPKMNNLSSKNGLFITY